MDDISNSEKFKQGFVLVAIISLVAFVMWFSGGFDTVQDHAKIAMGEMDGWYTSGLEMISSITESDTELASEELQAPLDQRKEG